MNPPSALHGAMSRERKPFTYTPGGIDLSQIKSERMAKRLIRNAMDQGVPEHPTSNIQSPPPTLSTTLNLPNYNCLPVQVFPTFPLPTNPKSLLKTRTNSVEQKEQAETSVASVGELKPNMQYGAIQSFIDDKKPVLSYIESRYENNNNEQYFPSYEYNVAPTARPYPNYVNNHNTESNLSKVEIDTGNIRSLKGIERPFNEFNYQAVEDNNDILDSEPAIKSSSDRLTPLLVSISSSENNSPHNLDDSMGTDKQKEVKVVKKQSKTENVTEEQNGDTDVQAAVTVKLPGKKSAAKTETKVEVVKKTLPDGSVEEVKTTTTKTTIDGKTEITTKTETTIIPKEDDYEEEEEVVEEEEEEEEEQEDYVVERKENSEKLVEVNENQENDLDEKGSVGENELEDDSDKNIQNQEESSESSVVKKVTIVQSTSQENSEDEVEQEQPEERQEVQQNDDEEEVHVESKKKESESNEALTNGGTESENDEDQDHEEIEEEDNEAKEEDDLNKEDEHNTEVESEKEEVDETLDMKTTKKENDGTSVDDINEQKLNQTDNNKDAEKIQDDSEKQSALSKDQTAINEIEQEKSDNKVLEESPECNEENKEEIIIEVQILKPELATKEEEATIFSNESKPSLQTERNIPLREPSVPLEKVEDVEIKPIGQIISKSHTENTEIITSSVDKPTTGLSTQTAYNRIENIVTVNRTTKTLDHAYEQISQHSVPMVKTSFVPNLENLSTSPQISRPYQPVYPPEPQPERRHSLLLDRLSVDRQMPPTELYQNNYQFTNQNYEQNQWSQEPQSEVLTVSNVKPSTITKNQQWYQQTKKEDIGYSTTPTLSVPSQQWNTQQAQPQHQQYLQPQPQANYQPQPQFQPSCVETQDSLKTMSNTPSTYQQNSFPIYTPKPTTWVNNNVMSRNTAMSTLSKPLNQISNTEKDNTESYAKQTHQFTSSYVPPPWEQDSQNIVPDDIKQSYYSPSTTNKISNSTPTTWTPIPTSKFSKPKPTSYIPPAPNQSFVKPVSAIDPPKMPGRKTYYSEYERRYISVPESTYIPTENKFQAQPDPSPQYYYDNNEPAETIEPEWRKELREFSEKTYTQGQYEQSSVKPPWEEDPKYYVPKVTTEYNPTPTWSQTLRPNTWRERSFESEFVRSKELPRTNTLGRGRPQSSYVKTNINAPIPERPRGVSVDRYNSNTYRSPVPSEYPPVVTHTLDPSIGSKTYHNPNVPAYHSRASAEPREQSAALPQARQWGESRAPPIQSRSFKYLQWITGTED